MSSKSMAVWGAARAPGGQLPEIETHFNYWRIAGDPSFRRKRRFKHLREFFKPIRDFVEIGVMLTNPQSAEKVCIYIPHRIESAFVEDCGPRFENTAIAQGIFNEPLNCTLLGRPHPECVDLKKDDELYCRVHKFMMSDQGIDPSELTISLEADGTLLTISRRAIDEVCRGIPQAKPAYFRLRVYLGDKKGSAFVTVISPADHFFQSGFDVIEYLDFRLNEARTLPSRIEAMMRNDEVNGRVPIRLIAFLTAVPVVSELAVSNTASRKNRLLEHKIWNQYVQGGIPKGMMVYHWKRVGEVESGIPDFSSFVKLLTRRSGLKIWGTYLLVAFMFGVLGNLVAAAVQPYVSGFWGRLWSGDPVVSAPPSAPAANMVGDRS